MGPVGQNEIIKAQLTTARRTDVDTDTVIYRNTFSFSYTNVPDTEHALWHTHFSKQVEKPGGSVGEN